MKLKNAYLLLVTEIQRTVFLWIKGESAFPISPWDIFLFFHTKKTIDPKTMSRSKNVNSISLLGIEIF